MQQVTPAGHSAVTIRVGVSTPMDHTSSSGTSDGPAVKTVTSPPVLPSHRAAAAAADTGRQSNASQLQPEDEKRSAVNIIRMRRPTFHRSSSSISVLLSAYTSNSI